MKLRTSFFNRTVFCKDLTRFFPVWAIYMVIGLIVACSNLGHPYHEEARYWQNSLGGMGIILCGYALLVAQLVFGELFQGRLCCAIHAFPVRREGLFLSHFAAGLAAGIGPNVVLSLVAMLAMGELWVVGLLWLAATALMYIAFFGIAVFCMYCAGNRFAAVAVYGLVNFLAVLILWFFEGFYLPLLYGVGISYTTRDWITRLTPVAGFINDGLWVEIQHSPLCKNNHYCAVYPDGGLWECVYEVERLGSNWIYAGVLAGVGLLFAALALLIYRKRHLEDAGDFISFKPIVAVFTVLVSACIGGLCYYIAMESYLGMFIGLILGFFVCRMLLERTVKVFYKKNWIKMALLLAGMALSLGLTWMDAAGVTRMVPDGEDVVCVTISDRYLTDYDVKYLDVNSGDAYDEYGKLTLTDPEQIQDILQAHRLLIAEGDASQGNDWKPLTIRYHLKNGTTLTRYYYTSRDSLAMQQLNPYINTPEFVLGFENIEQMFAQLRMLCVYETDAQNVISEPIWYEKLVEALFADATEGNLREIGAAISFTLVLEYSDGDGVVANRYMDIPQTAEHTRQWWDEYERWMKE